MTYQPPFTLTSDIVSLVAAISQQLGRLSTLPEQGLDLRLRRINRIRTVMGSLAIEGNTLTEEQITALLNGKPVLAPPRELQEARNALKVYERLPDWDGHQESDLLAAHQLLMKGLLDHPGRYRTGDVGATAGLGVVHMAPPANRVHKLMRDLFNWLGATREHPLIASSVFHYEFEFIHPFADGNGRMGRLWQTLAQQDTLQVAPHVDALLRIMQGSMSRQAMQDALRLADRENFRKLYLLRALEAGLVEMTQPDKPRSKNQRYRLTVAGALRQQNL
jgi:Fic family protein